MLLEEALYSQLAEDSDIAALVVDRVFPVEVPQFAKGTKIYPCLIYRLANRPGVNTLDGVTNFAESTVEITALAQQYLDAKRIARAVRRSLDGTGPNDPLAALCVDTLGAQKIAETEIKENDPLEEVDVFNVTQTWVIKHVED